MAISTYAELKAAVQSWGKRSDIPGIVGDLIALAEKDMWQKLKSRELEATATASTSITSRALQLPDLYISFRRIQILVDGIYYDLEYVNPQDLSILDSASIPSKFTINEQIEFNCISDQTYTVEVDYYKELPPLSDSNTTNDILTNHPMLYLSGALKECGLWSKDLEMATVWETRYLDILGQINRRARSGRYPPGTAPRVEGMIV